MVINRDKHNKFIVESFKPVQIQDSTLDNNSGTSSNLSLSSTLGSNNLSSGSTTIIYQGGMTWALELKLEGIEEGALVNLNAFSFITIDNNGVTNLLPADLLTDSFTIKSNTPIELTLVDDVILINYIWPEPILNLNELLDVDSTNLINEGILKFNTTTTKWEIVDGSDLATRTWVLTQLEPYATQLYVINKIDELIGAAPGALDTLEELALALGDDPNFATTVTNLIAGVDDRVDTVEASITTIQGNITTILNSISTINTNISNIEDDISDINTSITNIGKDIDSVESSIASINSTIDTLPTFDDLTWANIIDKPSWIGSTKPTYQWSEILNKPSWIGSTKPTYSWSEIQSKPTTLSGFGITDGVNAVSIIGNGNAVTTANVSGHTLTLTKDSTFLLSSAYTAADVLAKLKTVDGSDSGLDADLFDGLQSDLFFRRRSTPSGTSWDWNSLLINASYPLYGVNVNWSTTNAPDGSYTYGTLVVFDGNANTTLIYIPHMLNSTESRFDIKIRSGYDGVFTVWRTLLTADRVNLATINDLHANWDALLKATPSTYVTRWPTWSEVTSKPSWIGSTKPTYTFAEITSKPTTLAGFGIKDGVNTVSIDGSGNVLSTASVSGHTLTLTKGITALTSHLAIYQLTLQVNGVNIGTFNPKTADATINITADDLGAITTINLASITDLHSSWDAVLATLKPDWITQATADGRYAYVGGSNASGTWSINITGNANTLDNLDSLAFARAQSITHGEISTTYTPQTYISNFTNSGYFIADRGKWSYADNGYITTDFGNIHLAGTAVATWKYGNVFFTQLYITPSQSYGVSNPLLNEMLFYSYNTADYLSGWTRVLTNRNYASYTVTKTGSGASGTWGISITGNAATATNADTLDGLQGTDYLADRGTLNDPADWDSYINPSYYTVFTNSGGYTGNNYPSGAYNYGGLMTLGDSICKIQIYIPHFNPSQGNSKTEVRIRNTYSTVWSDWRNLAFIDSNVASASKLATARTINGTSFDGTASITTSYWGTARTLTLSNYLSGSVSINGSANVTLSANVVGLTSQGNKTAISGSTVPASGLRMYQVYKNGYPCNFGNLISVKGLGAGELLLEWSGSSAIGHLYYRSQRDMSETGWSDWSKVAFTSDLTVSNLTDLHSSWDSLLKASKPTMLSGYGITDAYTKTEGDGRYMYHYRSTALNADSFNQTSPRIHEISSGTNMPTSNEWHQIMTWGTGDSRYIFQLANTYVTSGSMYFRQMVSGSWGAWKKILDTTNYTSTLDSRYLRTVSLATITDLHSSWDAVLKAQKPAWLTTVSLATISDLHSGWDALLKAAPSVYVTRWPLFAEVTSKPTTLSGYGITNAVTTNTEQTITALKTFSGNIVSQLVYGVEESGGGMVYFYDGKTMLGSIGPSTTKATHIRSITGHATIGTSTVAQYTILDTGNYTSTLDSRYVKKAGDTMTGGLLFPNSSGGAWNNPGIRFTAGSRIGEDSNGNIAIYGANAVAIRPSSATGNSGLGIYVTGTSVTFNSNTVWHSGNDGAGSGLDADLLDGIQADKFFYERTVPTGVAWDWNDYLVNGVYSLWGDSNWSQTNAPAGSYEYGNLIVFDNSSATAQLYIPNMLTSMDDSRACVKVRSAWDGKFGAWRSLAFTTSNVASATQLQTARTINGTAFNGTSNIVTSYWGTARTLSLTGNATGSVSMNGSSNVSMSVNVNYASSAGNADTLDGRQGTSYAIAWGMNADTDKKADDTTSTSITDFLTRLNYSGIFGNTFGAMRGSWYYVGNTQYNTGVGTIEMAGTAVLNMSQNANAGSTFKTLLFLEGPTGNMYSYVSQGSGVARWSRYAKTTDNVYSASKLQTSQKIWGRPFDGTAPVSGDMTEVGSITGSGNISMSGSITAGAYVYSSGWFQNQQSGEGLYNSAVDARWYANSSGWISDKKINANAGLSVTGTGNFSGGVAIGGTLSAENGIVTDYNAGTYIEMATRLNLIRGNQAGTQSTAHALYRVKDYSGNAVCFGGIGNQVGFYGFYASTISAVTNGVDWSTYWNASNGQLLHSKDLWVGGAVSFNSTLTVTGAVTGNSTIYAETGVYSNGYVTALNLSTSSDMRLKTVIRDANITIEDIAKAPSFIFKWNENGLISVGTSAQYWKQILPEAVQEINDYYTLLYGNIAMANSITLARETIKLKALIEKLKRKIKQLEKLIKWS